MEARKSDLDRDPPASDHMAGRGHIKARVFPVRGQKVRTMEHI